MRTLVGVPVGSLAVALTVLLGLVVAGVAAAGLRHRVFVKLGVRNGARRRARTTIIVVGLMLGTAIIASALGTGDTMSRTIRSSVLHSLGATDEVVRLRAADTSGLHTAGRLAITAGNGQETDLGFFPQATFDAVGGAVAGSELVDGTVPAIGEAVAAQNTTRRRTEPRLTLFAPDPARLAGFNPLTLLRGRPSRLADLGLSEVYLDEEAAKRLGARPGDGVSVLADGAPLAVTVRGIVRFDGSGSDRGSVILPLAHAQQLLGRSGLVNQILVSNTGGSIEGAQSTRAVRRLLAPTLRPLGLEARPVKADGLDSADAQGDAFMTLFTTFGMFTIAAGVLLIFLIFVMLAAERRSELGTERAVGMQRRHLVEVFLFEGMTYDVLAAAVGTAFGLLVAYGMVEAIANAFNTKDNSFEIVHSLSSSSIAISYALGVLLTFVVVTFSAWRVSRLNIVTAIRQLPDRVRSDRTRRRYVSGLALGVLGGAIAAVGAANRDGMPFLLGCSLVIVAAVLLACALHAPPRGAYTLGGIVLVAWWLLPFRVYRSIVPGLRLDYAVFVVGGLMVVLGVTWAVIHNADMLSRGVIHGLGRARSLAPVLRTSLAYPARNRFRTGTTIALFTLVVFTLVVGATTSGAFGRAFDDTKAFGGGFQVRAAVAPGSGATDLTRAITDVPGVAPSEIRTVASQSSVPLEVRQGGPHAGPYADYPVRGVDDTFLRSTTYGFAAQLGATAPTVPCGGRSANTTASPLSTRSWLHGATAGTSAYSPTSDSEGSCSRTRPSTPSASKCVTLKQAHSRS